VIETETEDTPNQDTAPGKRPLPDGWRWVRLGDVCTINPPRPRLERDDDALTAFVPMPAVAGAGRGIVAPEQRSFASVRKGYTFFAEGDVLFAKISPCMQNGKHAVARNLLDGIGFGSTEFHVLRVCSEVIPEWIHQFIIQPRVLDGAVAHFSGAVGQQRVPESYLAELTLPLPPLAEQRRIAAILTEQMLAVERARTAAEAQLELSADLVYAYLRQSVSATPLTSLPLNSALTEVSRGVGDTWREYPVMGATRAGLAPAKEGVGKTPGRYKLVDAGTIFYNPMRILLGSIAMIDDGDEPGITSPDYVVLKTRDGVLHPRWFYYWLRSRYGEAFIKTLARGAVRERMLFRRLAEATIDVPPWPAQCETADKLRAVARLRKPIVEQLGVIDKLPATLLQQAFSGEL